MQGVINVYKEKGWTSHDVVSKIRVTLKQNGIKEKVGHTGTLDPNATGVLPICIGKATKLSDYIMDGNKVYKCQLILGLKTNTDDITGEIIQTSDIPTESEVKDSINSFIGSYYQTPPMYSALKVNGKKLYEYARKGQEIEVKKRLVNIEKILIEKVNQKEYELTIYCSKGTYIRSLCRDIGEKINVASTMGDLERVKTGSFIKENAKTIDNVCSLIKENNFDKFLIPIEEILEGYRKIIVLNSANKYLYNGNKINIEYVMNKKDLKINDKFLVYDQEDTLIGIYSIEDYFLKPKVYLFDR